MSRAIGVDISAWQEAYDPTVKEHDFVIIRASDGIYTDTRYHRHLEETLPVLVRGAYQYFRSGHDWKRQADLMLELTANQGLDILALDFEKKRNTISEAFAANTKRWLDYVTENATEKVMLYTSPSVYQEWLIQQGQAWMNDYDLWIAQWPFHGWDDQLEHVIDGTWEPRLPAGHKEWKLWQYSADYNEKGAENGVTSRDVDLDVFNGTVDAMLAWIRGHPLPPAPPETSDWNDAIEASQEASHKALEAIKR